MTDAAVPASKRQRTDEANDQSKSNKVDGKSAQVTGESEHTNEMSDKPDKQADDGDDKSNSEDSPKGEDRLRMSWMQARCGDWVWGYRSAGKPEEFDLQHIKTQPKTDSVFVFPASVQSESTAKPQHGDLIYFEDYRGCGVFVLEAIHGLLPYAFRVRQTKEEYGYYVPAYFSDAPLDYYDDERCPARVFWKPTCHQTVLDGTKIKEVPEHKVLLYSHNMPEYSYTDSTWDHFKSFELRDAKELRLEKHSCLTKSIVWFALIQFKKLPRGVSDLIADFVPTIKVEETNHEPEIASAKSTSK